MTYYYYKSLRWKERNRFPEQSNYGCPPPPHQVQYYTSSHIHLPVTKGLLVFTEPQVTHCGAFVLSLCC